MVTGDLCPRITSPELHCMTRTAQTAAATLKSCQVAGTALQVACEVQGPLALQGPWQRP